MGDRHYKPRHYHKYRAYYTIGELAEMSGIDYFILRRLMKSISHTLEGKDTPRLVVYQNDLVELMPRFWASVLSMVKMRQQMEEEGDDFKAESYEETDEP